MARPLITVAMVLQAIDGWRQQLQALSEQTDPDQRLRLLIHLDTGMEQVALTLRRLSQPDDPLA